MYKQDLMHPNQKCSIGVGFQGPEPWAQRWSTAGPQAGSGQVQDGDVTWDKGQGSGTGKFQQQLNQTGAGIQLEPHPLPVGQQGEGCSPCSKRQHNTQLISSRTGCMAKPHRARICMQISPGQGGLQGAGRKWWLGGFNLEYCKRRCRCCFWHMCGSARPWRRIIREGKECKLLLLKIPGG